MAIRQIDNAVLAASSTTGIPPDMLRIASCLFLSFPLSAILKRLPTQRPVLKQVYILVCAYFYLLGIFSYTAGTIHLMVDCLFTYILVRAKRTSPMMPVANFLVLMVHMLYTHYQEQIKFDENFSGSYGYSGSQMILLIRLTSYAWDVHDGTHKDESSLSDFQRENRILQVPPLLRYLSWALFFPAVLTGPACGYREFSQWLDLSVFNDYFAFQDKLVATGKRKPYKRKIPRSGHVALAKALEGIFWAYIYIQSGNYFDGDTLFQPRYRGLPFTGRILFLWALSFAYRMRYYAAWCISEAACIHTGLGYNCTTEEGKIRWDRVRNVRPIKIETAQNIHGIINNWNMNTAKWLRYYVFLRVTPKGKKPGSLSTFITFVVSSLWHGILPGYYLMFVLGALMQMFGKIYRRYLRPVVLGTSYKRAYDVITYVCTQAALGYAVQPFVVLEFYKSLKVWASVYFYVHIVLLVSWFLFLGPGRKRLVPYLRSLHEELNLQAD